VDVRIEQQVEAGRTGEPAVLGDLVLELPRAPAGITQRHQRMARPVAGGDGAQDVDGGGQADLVGYRHRGFDHIVIAVQDEAAAAIDRAAMAHDDLAGAGRQADGLLLVKDAELDQKVGEEKLLGLIDDEAHRPLLAMGADIDDGTRETLVPHARHGDEELVVEVAGAHRAFPFAQKVHGTKASAFPAAAKERHAAADAGVSRNYDGEPPRGAVAKPGGPAHIRAMIPSRTLSALCFMRACATATGAQAASSGWHHVEGGSIRIVTSGNPDGDGLLRGALEIRLKPGWKTYWRDPGAAGVPPTLTASAGGSDAAVEIGFPAPGRFDDGYAQSAGYDRPVALALTLRLPEDANPPARLQADVFLGVCETICIPVQATLSFEPGSGSEQPEHAAVVKAAFDALPAPARPGFAAEAGAVDDKAIMVETALPEGV